MEAKSEIKFHIKNDDYFGTLATVLDFTKQDISKRGFLAKHGKILNKVNDDLMFLQGNYKIVKK